MKRTNLFLFVLAIGLFAYVALVDRHGLSTSELDEREGKLVEAFVRSKLVMITVERDGERYSLSREERDADGNIRFAFATPLHVAADASRVDAALSSIEWAEPTRSLRAAEGDSLERYGLLHPRLRVGFEVGDRTVSVAFGRQEPTGAGVYVSVDGAVFVAPDSSREAFDHPMEFFRVRRLVELQPNPSQFFVRSALGSVRARLRNGIAELVEPVAFSGSEGRLNVLLSTLRTLEAERFVDENPTDVTRFGLVEPKLLVEVGDDAAPTSTRVLVGNACDEPAASSYVRVGDGPVACVADDDLAPLFVSPDAYRELRASATEAGGVSAIDLADGSATLSARTVDGGIRVTLGEWSGEGDPEAFEEWIESLRETRASEVLLATEGFEPSVTLTVHRTGTRADDVIRFDLRGPKVRARRAEDQAILVFPNSIRERLEVTSAHFRARGLLHEDPSSLRELVINRGASSESLELVDGTFRVRAPIAIEAEQARVAELASRLGGLEAVRFVADAPRPEFGLERPRFVVRFKLGEVQRTLTIGAATDDGAFARLDQGPVFVLVEATVELVASPLASRQELSTEAHFVETLALVRGRSTRTLSRDGPHFSLDGAEFEDARGTAALMALADLRAIDIVSYGAPRPETGLSRPATTIRIRRSAEAGAPREVVLFVGATVGEGEEAKTFVRRSDLQLVYQVATTALGPILSLSN